MPGGSLEAMGFGQQTGKVLRGKIMHGFRIVATGMHHAFIGIDNLFFENHSIIPTFACEIATVAIIVLKN